MSYCKAILVAFLSFWSSASLMGMNSKNYTHEEIKKLLLFKQAVIEGKFSDSTEIDYTMPDEVKNQILQNGYYLHCEKAPLSQFEVDESDLANLYDQDRMNRHNGVRITKNDPHLIDLNNEGREVFGRLLTLIPHKQNDGTFQHPYSDNKIENSKKSADSYWRPSRDIEKKKLNKWGLLKWHLLSEDDYNNEILKLPVELRQEVGNLCTVKVLGQEQVPFLDKCKAVTDNAKYGMITAGLVATIAQKSSEPLLKAWAATSSTSSSGDLSTLDPSVKGLIGLGLFGGTMFGYIFGTDKLETKGATESERAAKVFNVVEKPLVPLKEKEMIQKEKKARIIARNANKETKAYENEIKNLQQHLKATDPENRNAIEQEIKSLENNRMAFARSNMKTDDFEDLQLERNAAAIEKTWNDLPWYKKLFYVGAPSDLNPDVKRFNKLQEKHAIRRAVNLQKQQQQKFNHE